MIRVLGTLSQWQVKTFIIFNSFCPLVLKGNWEFFGRNEAGIKVLKVKSGVVIEGLESENN